MCRADESPAADRRDGGTAPQPALWEIMVRRRTAADVFPFRRPGSGALAVISIDYRVIRNSIVKQIKNIDAEDDPEEMIPGKLRENLISPRGHHI